jgi:predicted small secreted protein
METITMKKTFLILFGALSFVLTGCNNSTDTGSATTTNA